MRTTFTLSLVAALVCAASADAVQNTRLFKARLSAVPIDLTMRSVIAGSGTVTATLDGNKLTIMGTFEGLRSPATVARIHRGFRGVRGPAFADLKATAATSGTITGTIDLTPSQVTDLGKSLFYVQLHSEKAPDGNLWGWLMPVEGKK